MMYDPESRESELSEVMPLTHTGMNVNYHFRKNLAFVCSDGILFRSPLLPKLKTPAIPVQLHRSCDEVAVDWEEDVLYISDPSNNTILSINLEGKNETIVLRRPEEIAYIHNMDIDPYSRLLIWTADGVLESCDLSCQNFRTNLSEPEDVVRTTTLHLVTRTLYYVAIRSVEGFGLFSLQYDRPGASPQRLVALDWMSVVCGLGVFRDHIYWIKCAASRHILYKALLNVSSPDDVVVVKIIEQAAWHMRLVHPELQSRPVLLDLGQDLKLAQVTGLSLWTVVFGLLSVGLIPVLAVVLLPLTDTRWSRLQALFSRAPARQDTQDNQEHEPPAYSSSDDRVLLM